MYMQKGIFDKFANGKSEHHISTKSFKENSARGAGNRMQNCVSIEIEPFQTDVTHQY